MKGLPRRLFFYAIGLAFGLLIAVYLVKGKTGGELPEYCYLPNCRVLKALRANPLHVRTGSARECPLDQNVLEEILTDGDVLFSRSDPRKEPCGEYLVEYREFEIRVQKCPDTTWVTQVACSPAADQKD